MKKRLFHPLHYSIHSRLRAFHLKRLIPKNGSGNFLDVGCGLGYLAEVLGQGYFRIGLESDNSSIQYNRDKGLINMVRGDASRLPFKKDSLDLIVCSEVLEHLPDKKDEDALMQMVSLLKPGGLLLLTVPSLEGIRAYSKLRNLGHEDRSGGEFHYRIGYHWDNLKRLINTIPAAKIKNRRYSMFLFSELFMDIVKAYYFKKNNYKEHSDIGHLNDSPAFRLYCLIFPIIYLLGILEDILLCSLFKGHILILALEKKNG